MITPTLTLTGAEETLAHLRNFAPEVEGRVVGTALKKAVRDFENAAKARAPIGGSARPGEFARGGPKQLSAREVRSANAKRRWSEARRSRFDAKKAQQPVEAEGPRAESSPGRLRAAIQVRRMRRSRKRKVGFTVGAGAKDFAGDQWYGAAVVYGTHKMRPRNFLREAFLASYRLVQAVAVREIAAGVARMAKKRGLVSTGGERIKGRSAKGRFT